MMSLIANNNDSSNKQTLTQWHSLLFVPAHQERYIHSAARRAGSPEGADVIILDLEDSVPDADKPKAREQLPKQVHYLLNHNIPVAIRINSDMLNSVLDLQACVIAGVSAIFIPKAMGADHLRLLDDAISTLEECAHLPTGQIQCIAMIESLEGLLQLDTIATSTPRVTGLALGSEDLSLDGGFDATPDNLFYPAQQIVYAAKRARIQAYGFPGSIADYSDTDTFTQWQQRAKSMGFSGALCIHPKQVDIVNTCYRISEADIESAQRIVNAYAHAIHHHKGAVEVDGKMVDAPVVERAKAILRKAGQ